MTETAAELVHVPARTGADLAMLDRSTDSWTVVLQDVADLANRIARTDFVPESHRGNVGQVAAVILHGRELGLPPMTALASTHVIKGKPSISAEAMRALILQAGHELTVVESTSARCTIRGRRRPLRVALDLLQDPSSDITGLSVARERRDRGEDVGDWTTVTWTMDDARQAGLLSNHTYKAYPRQMLAARATAELARLIFPDVIHGMRAIEEMDDVTPWDGPATAVEQTAAPATTKVRRARKTEPTPAPAQQQQDQPPAAEQAAPERRRPALPTRDRRPESATVPPVTVPDSTDAGADVSPTAPASPSIDEQQAEVRQLAEQHRADQGKAPAPAEPVDAEVIDVADRRPISPGQRGFLMSHFKRLGVEERTMRLSYSMALTGRDDLESSNQLTFAQASELIKALEGCRDLDALDTIANGQDTLT